MQLLCATPGLATAICLSTVEHEDLYTMSEATVGGLNKHNPCRSLLCPAKPQNTSIVAKTLVVTAYSVAQ